VHGGRLEPGVQLITKPFTYATLAAKLRSILDARAGPARILLVEDERLIRLAAVEQLQELGFKVETAGSATEAMSKLKLIKGDVRLRSSTWASPTGKVTFWSARSEPTIRPCPSSLQAATREKRCALGSEATIESRS
jgi:hypothetical protein